MKTRKHVLKRIHINAEKVLKVKSVISKEALVENQIIHTLQSMQKSYQCGHCSKSFVQKEYFENHTLKHNGEKPYQYRTCGKGFTHSSLLIQHQRIHTREKPYQCSTYGRCFTRRSDWITHK